jgi:MFS family permease
MPLAIGVGRRIVILVSTLILVVGAVVCATAKDYSVHLFARCLVGIAAGQSEALVPMITQVGSVARNRRSPLLILEQELYFLHERSKYLMTQQAIQVILTTVYVIFASPIAGVITPEWWYGLGAALSAVMFILTALFLPETKYERPLSSFQEATDNSFDLERTVAKASPQVVLCTVRPQLDTVNHESRTFRSDLRLWVGKPDFKAVVDVYKVITVTDTPLGPWASLTGL